jgi:predicted dehydrogenase
MTAARAEPVRGEPVRGEPVGVAVVGCGTISNEYLRNLTSFPDLRVLFCADIDLERAKAQADTYGVPASGSTAQALEHPDVELVVNLTLPATHAAVAQAAIAAGKSVWMEKPLALDTGSARVVLAAAAGRGLLVGCAPDTMLGAGLQTARRVIEAGTIGEPQTALALLQGPGPEGWHPAPEFLFQPGAGPLFDMGPYYLSALATLFGPADQVAALGRRARDTRTIGSGPRAGTVFGVEVPTHVAALIGYVGGQAATVVLSFDSALRRHGFIEISGTDATLALPDPNRFDGEIRVRAAGAGPGDDWTVIPAAGATAGRGLGVLDMARALRGGGGTALRASGEMALHVLDTMEAIGRSVGDGRFQAVGTTFTVPGALTADWDPHVRTLA